MTQSEQLKKLNLHFLADNFETFITRSQKNPDAALTWWLDQEIEAQRIRSENRRKISSKIGLAMSLKDFDWSTIEKPVDLNQQIKNLIEKKFVNLHRNVILIGAEGLGKTALARILGLEAVLAGHTCLFVTAADLISDLNLAEHPMARQKILVKYLRPNLLIIDEVGYVSCNEHSADNLFQVVSKRYDLKKPMIVTTNLAFKDWAKALGGAHCTSAIVDRLIENASVINIIGKSYRLAKHQRDLFGQKPNKSKPGDQNGAQ